MKALKSFVSGLLLSAVFLLPTTLRAAEVQPFFTFKTSSINSLVGIAQKIGTMAGFADSGEFQQVISMIKGIKGFNFNGNFGFAAVVDENEDIYMLLMLPVSDLANADIPAEPTIFDQIRPFLTPKAGGRTDINSPLGTFVALQKQGYLVIVPEDIVDQIPADARTLFADLEKYTIGMKLDLEKIKFETLEGQIFGWVLMFLMMQDPDMGKQAEEMVEVFREAYKEIAVMTGGYAFDLQTADLELSNTVVVRKSSEMGKSLAGHKQQPTIFSGFRGTPDSVVCAFGNSESMPPLSRNALTELNMKQYDALFDGILVQIEMEDESGEAVKIAKDVIDTIKKISDKESKRGSGDFALSLSTDGTLLAAADTVSITEIQKLAALAAAFANEKLPAGGKALIEKSLKKEYAVVEGFKVSSLHLPIIETIEAIIGHEAPDDSLNDLKLGIFWATKEAGGKQAIAVAAGLDFAKAEAAFKSALEKTKTPIPAQKPLGIFSVPGLGKFLQQTVLPIAAKTEPPEDQFAVVKQMFNTLAKASNEATVTMDTGVKGDRIESNFRISGKVIETLITVIKIGIEQSSGNFGPGFGNF